VGGGSVGGGGVGGSVVVVCKGDAVLPLEANASAAEKPSSAQAASRPMATVRAPLLTSSV
jgi:hypothetical protein